MVERLICALCVGHVLKPAVIDDIDACVLIDTFELLSVDLVESVNDLLIVELLEAEVLLFGIFQLCELDLSFRCYICPELIELHLLLLCICLGLNLWILEVGVLCSDVLIIE